MGKSSTNKTKLTNAEKQKRYREKRKLNAEREAEYAAKHKARNAKRKTANEMTEREHRNQKKNWKKWKQDSRKKEQIQEQHERMNTPPSTPPPEPSVSGNTKRGRKFVLKNRSKCFRENKKLIKLLALKDEQILNEKRKKEKYKKRLQRQNKKDQIELNNTPENNLTPNSKTKKMLNVLHNDLASTSSNRSRKNLLHNSKIARTLKFHNTMVSTLKKAYKNEKSATVKRHISSALSSKLIQRYRLRMAVSRALGLKASKRILHQRVQKENVKRFVVENFYLNEDISRATAGTKETITRKKIKKQKRYLLSSMKSLYKKFNRIHPGFVSYSTFARYRPFYVLKPSEVTRDTCLCKQHSNISLKAKKLRQLKLITDRDPHILYTHIVCDKTNAKCMHNICEKCKDKDVPLEQFSDSEKVEWEKWVIKKETKEKKRDGEKVQVLTQVTAKLTVNGTIGELAKEFQSEMKLLKKHAFNIKVQNKAYNFIKDNLKETEAVIHGDFSENFSCKLFEEVQSFHFGSSRKQVTLHTGILYTHDKKTMPFATISPSKDHGPPAIWAHLRPILNSLKESHPQVKTLHFFSDGPSSQYKQKNNFYLFSLLVHETGFDTGTWSFFESSHGKGAPDGVGGALKRMANFYVAHGCDIPDAETFFALLKENSKIKMFFVSEDEITSVAKMLPVTPLSTIVGTRAIHQLATPEKEKIVYRKLSCFCEGNDWKKGKTCSCFFPSTSLCFSAGKPKKKKKTKTRFEEFLEYTSSESDESEIEFQETEDEEMTLKDFQYMVEREAEEFEVLDTPLKEKVVQDTFVIVELLGGKRKKTKQKYAAIVNKVCREEEDGDYGVVFLQKLGEKGTSFVPNERDESLIDFDQIKAILPRPKFAMKGQRVIYEFQTSLDRELI